MLGRIRALYAPGAGPMRRAAFADSDRAWGLIPLEEYARAVEETFERDYTPRFAAHGVKVGEAS